MVQRPDGLRIHFHDEQRRQPRRPPSGCFRPPSKLTPGSDRKQMNKCFSGRRAAAPQGRCATSLFSKTLITVCHPGVLYRLQPVGGRNARFPLWATCVPPHHHPPSLCNAKEGEDMSCGCATLVSRLDSSCHARCPAPVCTGAFWENGCCFSSITSLKWPRRARAPGGPAGGVPTFHLCHVVSHNHIYI